jgi:hypothetical protein
MAGGPWNLVLSGRVEAPLDELDARGCAGTSTPWKWNLTDLSLVEPDESDVRRGALSAGLAGGPDLGLVAGLVECVLPTGLDGVGITYAFQLAIDSAPERTRDMRWGCD